MNSLTFNQPTPLSKGISISKTLSQLNEVPIRISKKLTYRKMPCVVGDCLEMKLAVKHFGLSQPTAYIGNIEIAQLLQDLDAVFTIDSVIDKWAALLGPKASTRLVVSLWSLGIFEKLL